MEGVGPLLILGTKRPIPERILRVVSAYNRGDSYWRLLAIVGKVLVLMDHFYEVLRV
jgi:hypothetical protein